MAKTYDSDELRSWVYDQFCANADTWFIKDYIAAVTGFKKTKVNELHNEFYDYWERTDEPVSFKAVAKEEIKPVVEQGLSFGDRYTYNKDSDQYIVYLKAAAKNVVVTGDTHRNMLKAYSNWNGSSSTINEICRNFSWPRKWFEEYKAVMGWSHDHEPISNEELSTKDVGVVVDDLLQQKRFGLYQEFQKKDWKAVQVDAQKWREFQAGKLDPFESFLNNLSTKDHALPAYDYSDMGTVNSDLTLVVSITDLHAGGLAEQRYLYRGKEWNIERYKETVKLYAEKLHKKVSGMLYKPNKLIIIGLGDLLHGLGGCTVKGTPLTCDRLQDTQFDVAFESLLEFISSVSTLAPIIEVHSVRGNHEGVTNHLMFKALQCYFRMDTRLSFFIDSADNHAIKVGSTLLLMSHGASASYKAKVPSKGKARESYVQSLLLAKPELLVGVKQKLYCVGDMHSFKTEEFNDMEVIQFSTCVSGDGYAEALNLHSRPRQSALLIDGDGLAEIIHCYLD